MNKFIFLLITTLACTTSVYSETTTLRLAETWGPNFPIFGEATKRMADLAKSMSNGRLIITIDSADVHGQPLGVFNLVKSGEYDLGHSASYYWKDEIPNTLYFSTMPFGMIAAEQYAWFYQGDGMDLMEEVYAPHNLYSFPGGNTGQQMGGWFNIEINSVEDLNGLKMRIPGFAGEVISKLGVETINIPSGELYDALKSKKIDALEWVGPSLDLQMGFPEIAKYYYTGWHEPATELQFLVNRQVLDSLPVDLREILKVAMRLSAYDMWIQTQHESAINWQRMSELANKVEIREFPSDVMTKLRNANAALLIEKANSDPLAAKIIASQSDYLKIAREWIDISERAYTGNMNARGNRN
ncbi:TRAP transporter substrate-binding protein [Reinekea sp.]|jgi:TRAP-type mannitol/chloroaromatic compound transport system substrate-binding protein|uniref:TRAP transporter substrate-binding protein n=1 Tax=Reinekea sp. TaxID=1970455 RepID=UPI0039896C79